MTWLGRVPVRVRVTLAVTLVMAIVLGATGLFLYLRLGAELDSSIDQGLRARAGDVSALVRNRASSLDSSGRSALTDEGENLAQVLDSSGAIVDSTPTFRRAPLLSDAERTRARQGTLLVDRDEIGREGEPARLLATTVNSRGRTFTVVVGAPLDDRRDALDNLAGLLLLGGPVALLLASVAGYGAAAAALRPVERMRREAAEIQAGTPSARLPVPPTKDEIGRLGTTLNAMLVRLEEAFDRERTFVADASHELRTPLAILKGELELALRGGRSSGELEAALGSAAEETDRLVQLAEDLLVIARSDQGRLPIRVAPVQARDLLEDVSHRFEQRAVDAGATLSVSAPDGLGFEADPLRLEQAISNLVDNALRYGAKTVELTAVAEDGGVALRVVDDGPGFPAAFVGRALERFTRADSARGRGGSGLGLAIVDVIARAHGGTTTARNNPDPAHGAWVSIRLPGQSS